MLANPILSILGLLVALTAGVQSQEKPFVTWNHPPSQTNPLTSHHTYQSDVMKTAVGYNIYLPPGYADPANTNHYPVIYWLHGKGGSENGDVGRAGQLDAAIRENRIPPLINVWVCGGEETYYSDSFNGKWMAETTIIKELIPHVDATYRTHATRGQRAIQGMSMGGFGAMRLGLKYPELFSSIVSFAGGYRDTNLMTAQMVKLNYEKMFNNDPTFFMSGHPFTTALSNADRIRGQMAIKLFCGTKDYLLEPNRRMHSILNSAHIDHEYDEVLDVDHNMGKYAEWIGVGNWMFAAKYFEKPGAKHP